MKKLEAKRFRSAVANLQSASATGGAVIAVDPGQSAFLSHNQAEGGQPTDLIAAGLDALGIAIGYLGVRNGIPLE